MQAAIAKIAREIDDDVMLLPERHWWGPIEDDISGASAALDEVDGNLYESLAKIAEVTGEDEPEIDLRYAPLPKTLPTKEEVFVWRRQRAIEIRKARGLE